MQEQRHCSDLLNPTGDTTVHGPWNGSGLSTQLPHSTQGVRWPVGFSSHCKDLLPAQGKVRCGDAEAAAGGHTGEAKEAQVAAAASPVMVWLAWMIWKRRQAGSSARVLGWTADAGKDGIEGQRGATGHRTHCWRNERLRGL